MHAPDTPSAPLPRHADVVVVGAGLAGLTAAAVAARNGTSVVVLDARNAVGGRARTVSDHGVRFNEGPHALYRAGRGWQVLRELGITPRGSTPPLTRSRLSIAGELHRVPPARAAAQLTALLGHLRADRRDPAWVHASAREWIEHRASDPLARQLAAAMVRVSSYSGDLTTFSADAAIAQLAASARGVVYLDGGWQQLVDELRTTARSAGATVVPGANVVAVDRDDDRWNVRTSDATLSAGAVVVAAGGPGAADHLTSGTVTSLAHAAARAVPVHAACLDLGLRRLPRPTSTFALGVDRPTYASVHTAAARLSDDGAEVLHVMWYEPTTDVGIDRLESIADELQPGWRTEEIARQVGRRRVVATDRPQVGAGMAGRPGAVVHDAPGLFVAGDWVGPDDLLGSASLASGAVAGAAAARRATGATTTSPASRGARPPAMSQP